MSQVRPASRPGTSGEERARFGQLTYTSFDSGDGHGGWRVKEATGNLDDAERDHLRQNVNTQQDAGAPMSRFPSPEEVAARRRSLVYRLSELGGAYWHTVPAGADASGRPGNVFAHTLLDRSPQEPSPAFRPVELWRSPDWLTPFGAEQVRSASLAGPGLPARGAGTGRSAVVDFLLDPTRFRLGVLAALLDAVSARLSAPDPLVGPPVVLGVAGEDEGALWVAAISYLMSPGTARRLGFSLNEGIGRLGSGPSTGTDLVVVPRGELEQARGRRDAAVVIDSDETVALGDLDGTGHRSAAGFWIRVTEWSVMTAEVMQEPGLALDLLGKIDQISARLGDSDLAPALPLALAVATEPSTWDDAGAEAARVLYRQSPGSLAQDPQLLATAERLLRSTMGVSTADAWAAINPPAPTPPRDHAELPAAGGRPVLLGVGLGIYAERALADREWLTRPDGVPPRGRLPLRAADLDRLAAVLAALVATEDEQARRPDRSPEAIAASALLSLRAVDFAHRCGLLDGRPTLQDECETLLQRLVVSRLLNAETAMELVRRMGPIAESTLATMLRPLVSLELNGSGGVPGSRLAPGVVDWLLPRPPEPPSLSELVASVDPLDPLDPLGPLDPLLVESAHQRIRRAHLDGVDARSTAEGRDPRPFALWGRLSGSCGGAEQPSSALDPYFDGPAWDPADLRLTIERFGPMLLPRHMTRTLVEAPRTEELQALCHDLQAGWQDGTLARRPPTGAADGLDQAAGWAAQLRRVCASRWWVDEDVVGSAGLILRLCSAIRKARADLRLAPDVTVSAIVALAVDSVDDPFALVRADDELVLAWRDDRVRVQAAAERLADAAQASPWLDEALAAVTVATALGAPPNDLQTAPGPRALAQLVGRSGPLLHEAYAIRARRPGGPTRDELFEQVKRALHRLLGSKGSGTGVEDLRRFARTWCRENAPPSGGNLHGALHRLRRSP